MKEKYDFGGYSYFGKDEKEQSEIERYISVVPSERQKRHSELEYYSFIHFGINTMNNVEWGSGKEDISKFNPSKLDTDQWCKVLKESGSKGIIITAKHHDGFCLWDTEYTDHNVMNTPYGKDIVLSLRKSCDKFGLKLGIYLSPWDRHDRRYGTEEYNDHFVNQLTELCTKYGELFAVWFDGACGEGENGKKQVYDWERYYSVIRKYQSNAVISICGPDVRWIGNEGGRVRKSEWSVVPAANADNDKIAEESQKSENDLAFDNCAEDLGGRAILEQHKKLIWSPAEADVSVTTGWFYHNNLYYLFRQKRTAKQLADIYFNTVGGNASLLMNVPPDKNGLISKREQKTLKKFKALIDEPFKNELSFEFSVIESDGSERKSKDLDSIKSDGSFSFGDDEYAMKLDFKKETEFRTLVLQEDINFSQRVEEFSVFAFDGKAYKKINSSTVIGSKKIIRFNMAVKAESVVIAFNKSRSNPVLRSVKVYN